jgi:hypothetical protein
MEAFSSLVTVTFFVPTTLLMAMHLLSPRASLGE